MVFAEIDALAGSSGWIGAGLLGSVLAWLMFVYLPAKDKQLKEMMDAKDSQFEKMTESKDALAKNLALVNIENDKERRNDFKDQLSLIASHCKEEMVFITSSFKAELTAMGASFKLELARLSCKYIESTSKQTNPPCS